MSFGEMKGKSLDMFRAGEKSTPECFGFVIC